MWLSPRERHGVTRHAHPRKRAEFVVGEDEDSLKSPRY